MQLTRPLTTMSALARSARVPGGGAAARVSHLPRSAREPSNSRRCQRRRRRIENEHLLLEVDPATRPDREARPEGDRCRPRCARVEARRRRRRPAATPGDTVSGPTTERSASSRCERTRLVETGPVRAILRVESRYGSSTLREDYVLAAGAPYVDVRVTLDWHEQLKLLKLRYPTLGRDADSDLRDALRPPGASEQRGRGAGAIVGRRLGAAGRGLTVINDAKDGYDVRGGDIGISAVRSPVWAWHDPRELEEGGDFELHGPGSPDLSRPARSRMPATGATPTWSRRAAELNQPAVCADRDVPRRAASAARGASRPTTAAASFVTVVKGAEDGAAHYVVRAYETAGRATDASLRVLGPDDRGRVRRRTKSRRSFSAAGDAPSRQICSNRELARRGMATAGLARRGVALARGRTVGGAGLAGRARAGERRDDLISAGGLPDPYFERQSLLAEWVPERTWVYRRRVGGGTIEFDGVDHEATVFVDGEEVGHHVGAFTPFRVEVPAGRAPARGRRACRSGERGRRLAARAEFESTRAGWATAGTSARGWCTRESGGRSRSIHRPERLPGRAL